MRNDLIKGISLLKSSEYRLKIAQSLKEGIKTPSEVSKMTKIRLNHVSKSLKDLKENGLVECLNEESKKGRLYQITKLGVEVLNELS